VAAELHVTKRAAREIDRVAEWWAANRPSAPGAVRADLQAALALLVEQPGLGAEVVEASTAGFWHRGRILVIEAYDPIKCQSFCRPLGGGIEFGETNAQAVAREIHAQLSGPGAEVLFDGPPIRR
jgi:plasmid stabilization system protein ParE